MPDTSKFWDRMAVGYDAQSNARFAAAYRATIERSKAYLKPSDAALDFACGTGLTTLPLAASVHRIEAIDLSPQMIAIARRKAEAEGIENVTFQVADLFAPQFEEASFDVLMAFNILYFIKDMETALKRIHALLKPGGVFLSATDCLGERRSLLMLLQPLASAIGLVPYIRQLKVAGLEDAITAAGFTILESANLHSAPPNQFVAARRSREDCH